MSEKILVICEVLGVTPYELLSGTDGKGLRSNPSETLILKKNSDEGKLMLDFLDLDKKAQGRLLGYLNALKELQESER